MPDGAKALKFWPRSAYKKANAPTFLYQKIKENPHEVVSVSYTHLDVYKRQVFKLYEFNFY